MPTLRWLWTTCIASEIRRVCRISRRAFQGTAMSDELDGRDAGLRMEMEICGCTCGSIGAAPEVRRCDEHHRYFAGDRELTSVSKIIRSVWPVKKDFEAAPADVLENARDRGVCVDTLLTQWVNGKLDTIKAGSTREDAVPLFEQAREWIDAQNPSSVAAQVMLNDKRVAGTCDLILDGFIWDVKTVYNLDPSYEVQLGMYAKLNSYVTGIGILHLNKRFKEPKAIVLDLDRCRRDACLIYDAYFTMMERITGVPYIRDDDLPEGV